MSDRATKTVGDTIDELVCEYGKTTIGIFMLEMALKKAIGAEDIATIKIGGKLISEHEQYSNLSNEESKVIKRIEQRKKDREAVAKGATHEITYEKDRRNAPDGFVRISKYVKQHEDHNEIFDVVGEKVNFHFDGNDHWIQKFFRCSGEGHRVTRIHGQRLIYYGDCTSLRKLG